MKINVFPYAPINYTTEHKMERVVQNAQLVVSHALMKDALLVLRATL
jgi:UDP-N-acetylglucosamine transferase subunit ALG13